MEDTSGEPSTKRRKMNNEHPQTPSKDLARTLIGSISPPPLQRLRKAELPIESSRVDEEPKLLKSPFQLTWIQDLSEASNKDALSLKDILGDPLIAECWEFNYLHDLGFLMNTFDSDVRDLVKVHVIHGFWKNEDPSRQKLQMEAKKYPNLELHTAYMPEMFGTHHSKMLILIRHDDTAQVIIHTANMIPFDWANMTQAIWRSPLLPLLPAGTSTESTQPSKIGSGSRFKLDLLNYLKGYDTKRTICKPLAKKLSLYDFSSIRAALVASVPGKQGIETDSQTSWGWAGLKNVLEHVPVKTSDPEIVIQVSSIATLGSNNKWIDKTLFRALATSKSTKTSKPKFKIIFPTADEIRRSLNGYASGSAIHVKIQSAAQAKQLQYLKPMLCHWAGDGDSEQHPSASSSSSASKEMRDAGRKRAAPHIKTFIRFADTSHTSIDWFLLTSSNLSKQAWGEATNAAGDIRICSYEIGVLVWPELFGEKVTMVPTFKTDMPSAPSISDLPKLENNRELEDIAKLGDNLEEVDKRVVIGARMPYDLPLVPYSRDDEPWCATKSYAEQDWMGRAYNL